MLQSTSSQRFGLILHYSHNKSIRSIMKRTRQIYSRISGGLLLALLAVGLVVAGCGDDPVTVEGNEPEDNSTTIENPPPEDFDAVGTVSGRVLDRVTNAPIEGADVSIDAAGAERSTTTSADGSFRLTEVPANRSDQGDSFDASGTYNVHVVPNSDSYRDAYSAEVTLVYGADEGGSGAGNNLGASVRFH